jgi:hypothetical protein
LYSVLSFCWGWATSQLVCTSSHKWHYILLIFMRTGHLPSTHWALSLWLSWWLLVVALGVDLQGLSPLITSSRQPFSFPEELLHPAQVPSDVLCIYLYWNIVRMTTRALHPPGAFHAVSFHPHEPMQPWGSSGVELTRLESAGPETGAQACVLRPGSSSALCCSHRVRNVEGLFP